MKNSVLAIISFFSILFIISCSDQKNLEKTSIDKPEVSNAPDSVLRHVVLFKFKEEADPAEIKIAEDAFLALPSKISEIKDFEWGLNNSPEGINKGLTHCYLLTFHSEEDRSTYLPHPDHKAFGGLLGDILEDVLVVDYWTQK